MERMRLLSFLFICLPMMVSASTKAEIGGIWYELNSDGNATVISGESKGNYSGEVAIPEYVVYEGVEFSVTKIGEGAFSGCSDLNSLTIPSSINKIGVDAFSRCKNLESVYLLDLAAWCRIHFVKKTKAKDYGTNPLSYADHLYVNGKEVKDLVIPDGIKEIGYCAFQGCKCLTSVTLPNSVTSIDDYAFQGCSNMNFVFNTGNLIFIGSYAFFDCSSLAEITIPEGVSEIKDCVFSNCISLSSVNMHNGITKIGDYAFWGCESLGCISIPNSLVEVGEYAFAFCNGLTGVYIDDLDSWCRIKFGDGMASNPLGYAHHLYLNGEEIKDLVIPNNISSIEQYAFIGGQGFNSITIPNSVTRISCYAFWGCTNVQSLAVPNGVRLIGDYAFEYCIGLESVTFGNSLDMIGMLSFHACSNLTSLVIPDNVTDVDRYAFQDCSNLISVSIGSGITSVSQGCFKNCSNLESVIIPQRVESIGEIAFDSCMNLKDVYCFAEEVPYLYYKSAFRAVGLESATLYVPEVSVDLYKEEYPWYRFGNIVPLAEGGEISLDGMLYKRMLGFDNKVEVISTNSKLSELVIPEKITFEGISYTVASIARNAFMQNTTIESVIIPNGVIDIGESAFEGCCLLTNIKIGRGIRSIGSRAFAQIAQTRVNTRSEADILHVYCDANTVPVASTIAFEGTPIENGVLHVPDNLIEDYENTYPWLWFGSITTGVHRLLKENDTDVQIYNLHGHRITNPQYGLNIIRMGNKKVKKIVM